MAALSRMEERMDLILHPILGVLCTLYSVLCTVYNSADFKELLLGEVALEALRTKIP